MTLTCIESRYPMVICGGTGSGKTVVGNSMHAASDLSFLLNTQAKGYVRGQTITYGGAEDNEKIRRAIRGGASKFDIRPVSEDGARELEALRRFLWTLAENGVRITLVVDEAHDIVGSNEVDGEPLVKLCKRGREIGSNGGGIKTIAISQRIQSLTTDVTSLAEYVCWVGVPSRKDRDYLEREFAFPFEDVHEKNTRNDFMFTDEDGERVSHAFCVVKNGEVIEGPLMAHQRYAQAPS